MRRTGGPGRTTPDISPLAPVLAASVVPAGERADISKSEADHHRDICRTAIGRIEALKHVSGDSNSLLDPPGSRAANSTDANGAPV